MKTKSTLLSLLFLSLLFHLIVTTVSAQRRSRDEWQQPTAIMDSVGIKPGMIIGEAGAGDGYFTFHLSKRVGKYGLIYANDIDERSLKELQHRMQRDTVLNIQTILGTLDDPLFPRGKLDMIVMMTAFHDFTKPVEWMKNAVPCLKPGGRLVIIDPDPDKMKARWDHFLTREQLTTRMSNTVFTLERVLTFLEQDNIYIYKPAISR
ncbi:MAG: class I SAM-dependent methyltransferase [bacterium]